MARLLLFAIVLLVAVIIWLLKAAAGAFSGSETLKGTTFRDQTKKTMHTAARGVNWLNAQWEQAKCDTDSSMPKPDLNIEVGREIGAALSSFMTTAMLLVEASGRDLTPTTKAVVFGYAFGALDALGQAKKIGQLETLAIGSAFFFTFFDMGPEQSAKAVQLGAEMTKSPKYLPVVQAGGQDILNWLSRKDEYAPLRLFELIRKAEAEDTI